MFTEYTRPTPFIDSNHPAIVHASGELAAGCLSDATKAKSLFEFVRDSGDDRRHDSYIASDVLRGGGNLCYQRSILLAALCRAAGIPARLHLQEVTIHGHGPAGRDLTFAHGITGILLNGSWRLYEPVGNAAKWVSWTGDPARAAEMPVPFAVDRNCLFASDAKIALETLPFFFSDRTPEMVSLIDRMNADLRPRP